MRGARQRRHSDHRRPLEPARSMEMAPTGIQSRAEPHPPCADSTRTARTTALRPARRAER